MKLTDKYPLLKEGYDKLNCHVCDKLCYPDAIRSNGTVVYNRHKCKDPYSFDAENTSFEVDIDGNIVE